ncbi:MAG TPA: serine/threonine-protein kinase [Kofleriaceae bacterium]|nr:serine/threonine-protein kinase [Kofleriaceae bacterium]
MKVAPGTTIAGRFELRSQVGRGGMGAVFLAKDHATGRNVAVKVLALEGDADVARFARESSMVSTIRHPNVVEYVAHGETEGVHYLVQEWVDGITLGTQLRTIGVTANEALAVALGVADALSAAHALGVIHRDVKPSNIILAGPAPEGVKLVDFGIARMANEAGVLTRTGVMVGTPQYMSPEQARGQVFIDPASDVCSLGCVLYESLAGRNPFAGASPTATRAKVLLGTPPPLHQYCAEATPELAQLISEMLAKAPADRPQHGGEVAARLRALAPLREGPRRKASADKPTAAMPVKPKRTSASSAAPAAANCFVFVTPRVGSEPGAAAQEEKIAQIAERRGMEVHRLEDGSAMLASKDTGKPAALAAARVAIDIRDEVWDAAVTVFGQAYEDTITDAIDRGAAMLEQAQMDTLFGDVVDDEAAAIIIDEVVADLIIDEIPVAMGKHGHVLKAGKARSAPR